MRAPKPPPNEEARLAVLEACHILDTPSEWRFDDLVELAARICDTPIALVSLVDGERQWFKARVGLDVTHTARNISFCGHVVELHAPLNVPDATKDARFADNPLVTGFPKVRLYAGHPIIVAGHVMGSFCVIDTRPRVLREDQLQELAMLARQAASQLELRMANQKLEAQVARTDQARAETSQFFNLSLDLLCIADGQGILRRVNPAWTVHLGYAPQDLIGRPVTDFVHPEDVAATMAQTMALMAPDSSMVDFEHRFRAADDTWRRLRWTAAAASAEGFIFAAARDITQAHQLSELKSQFVSTVSHELRTPLTSIRGALGLVMGGAMGEVPAPMRDLLDIATRNSTRLVRLVNDILDIERIEAGKINYDLKSVDVVDLAREAVAGNQGFAETHQASLLLRAPEGPVHVTADSDRLRQVIDNLISNAAKFSPAGSPVEVRVRQEGHQAVIEVADRGPGIPPEFRARLFDRFAQADGSDTRAMGGSGLGLSICRAIVTDLGGDLDFDTVVGTGTIFRVRMPLRRRTVAAPKTRRSVLVCEDDHDVATLLTRMLESRGFEVGVAHTAAEARDALAKANWGVMTLDLGLPDQDGIKLLASLRQDGIEVPVVVLTGRDTPGPDDADGVVCWLQKPIDETDLVRCLRSASRGTGPQRILHVEDDDGLRAVVARLLGPDVVTVGASSLAEADALLREQSFDAVVLDLGLPDGDGASLLEQLPSMDPGLPVVLFTGQVPPNSVTARVQASLVKTRHSEAQLVEAIERLIRTAEHPDPPAA